MGNSKDRDSVKRRFLYFDLLRYLFNLCIFQVEPIRRSDKRAGVRLGPHLPRKSPCELERGLGLQQHLAMQLKDGYHDAVHDHDSLDEIAVEYAEHCYIW